MTFDRAWGAFVDEDANRTAPPDLKVRVLAAVGQPRLETPGARVSVARGLAIAASFGVSMMWLLIKPAAIPQLQVLDVAPGSLPQPVAYAAAVLDARPVVAAVQEARASIARPSRSEPPSPVLRLTPDPVVDLEPIQLVRLRMPREALQALGLVLLEPDTSGRVDVDVLVGEDGLPRAIRKVRVEPQ